MTVSVDRLYRLTASLPNTKAQNAKQDLWEHLWSCRSLAQGQ